MATSDWRQRLQWPGEGQAFFFLKKSLWSVRSELVDRTAGSTASGILAIRLSPRGQDFWSSDLGYRAGTGAGFLRGVWVKDYLQEQEWLSVTKAHPSMSSGTQSLGTCRQLSRVENVLSKWLDWLVFASFGRLNSSECLLTVITVYIWRGGGT